MIKMPLEVMYFSSLYFRCDFNLTLWFARVRYRFFSTALSIPKLVKSKSNRVIK